MDPDLVSAALDMDMEVAIEVPKSHHTTDKTTNNIDIATDEDLSKATTRITCKDCNRHFALISTEDRLVPCNSEQQKCTSCEPFQGFYETLQSREQEHAALLDKGPTHLGRVAAHWKYRNARVALENFLINIEALDQATQATFVTHAAGVQTECEAELNDISKRGEKNEHGLPAEVSPTTKRRLAQNSGGSNTERKRIKFSDTVEESPQYRSTLEYYRGAKEYVPGKYGAISLLFSDYVCFSVVGHLGRFGVRGITMMERSFIWICRSHINNWNCAYNYFLPFCIYHGLGVT